MLNSELIRKYNQEQNIIIISAYPEKFAKYSEKVCALGGFTKNLVEKMIPILKRNYLKCVIFTTALNNKREVYEEKGLLLFSRIFRRNNLISYFLLLKDLLRFDKIKKILIEFEFASFGDTIVSFFFLPFLLLVKILKNNSEIYFNLHQVTNNLEEIYGHLGWNKDDRKAKIFNFGLKFFYRSLAIISKKIIVLEEEFKERLVKIGIKKEKIKVIPHGVDNNLSIYSKKTARKMLNLLKKKFIILFFGYINWYKGADIFLRIAKRNKNLFFIIAGGISFTQKNKKHYRKYLSKFNDLPNNVLLTGFVTEEKIPLYYSACDLVLFPYRSMISSSGSLSLAFSFKKPVLLSSKLLPYKKSADFWRNMQEAGLKTKELFFSVDNLKINKIPTPQLQKLIRFSSLMKRQRDYHQIVPLYTSLLSLTNQSQISNNDHQLALYAK